MSEDGKYLVDLNKIFWSYRQSALGTRPELFDRLGPDDAHQPRRPPVFLEATEDLNVIVRLGASPEERSEVLRQLHKKRRHTHFGSMKSSQALAQSVFGNLIALRRLNALAGLRADEGKVAFFDSPPPAAIVHLDSPIDHLGEPTSTSVDVVIDGPPRVAIECKLTESEVGPCSRPKLPSSNRKYCNGTYARQKGRDERCSLSAGGVRYWEFVPQLFDWSTGRDHKPCPLKDTYQLVRTVLAACTGRDGSVDTLNAHALLLYDARNPAFRRGGKGSGDKAYDAVTEHLRVPGLLRRCSWQSVVAHLAKATDLDWLVRELDAKYGFVGTAHTGDGA